MKKTLCITLVLCLLFCQIAWAANCDTHVYCDMVFSRRMVNCNILILVQNNYDLTIELWNNGFKVETWHETGTGNDDLTEFYPAVHGETYTLKVYGTAGGQTVNCQPITRTY